MLRGGQKKPPSFHDLINSSPGLTETDRVQLHELRKIRNGAVHLEEHNGQKRAYEIRELKIDEIIKKDTAQKAIDLAWLIFQKSNSGKLVSN